MGLKRIGFYVEICPAFFARKKKVLSNETHVGLGLSTKAFSSSRDNSGILLNSYPCRLKLTSLDSFLWRLASFHLSRYVTQKFSRVNNPYKLALPLT